MESKQREAPIRRDAVITRIEHKYGLVGGPTLRELLEEAYDAGHMYGWMDYWEKNHSQTHDINNNNLIK